MTNPAYNHPSIFFIAGMAWEKFTGITNDPSKMADLAAIGAAATSFRDGMTDLQWLEAAIVALQSWREARTVRHAAVIRGRDCYQYADGSCVQIIHGAFPGMTGIYYWARGKSRNGRNIRSRVPCTDRLDLVEALSNETHLWAVQDAE